MTGRTVPDWVGSSPDSKIPTRVYLRVFAAHGGKCWLTGRKIMPGDAWELDHKVPLCMGGANSEANLAPALKEAHRLKAAEETSSKAKADRVRAKHLGCFPKSPTPLKSGNGFKKRWPSTSQGK